MTARWYPDAEDRIPATVVLREGDVSDEDWRARDEQLIHRAAQLRDGPIRSALDAGAGRGRLTGAIAAVAGDVVSLEPDPLRAAAARAEIGRHPAAIRVERCALASYEAPCSFDLVVCSHVVQHLSYRAQERAVRALRRLTCDGGVLVLMAVTTDAGQGALYETRLSGSDVAVTYERSSGDRHACLAGSPARRDGDGDGDTAWL